MKTINFLFVLMLVSTLAIAQDKRDLPEIKVTPPQFMWNYIPQELVSAPNNALFNEYLRDYLTDWAKFFNGTVQGTEVVRFVVTPEGKLADFKVINSVSSQVDHAMYEMLKATSGMWRPGYNNGDPVAMEKEISVVFKTQDSTDFDALAIKYLRKGNKELFVNNNPKKALRYLNHGMKYRPSEDCLLISRGICKYQLGDKEGAETDWSRMALSGISNNAADKFSDMKGYAALATYLENK